MGGWRLRRMPVLRKNPNELSALIVLTMKTNFIRRSLAVILCYAFMLTNTSYGEAASPSLKSQLSSLVTKASNSWPKNGAYTLYKTGTYTPYEVSFYGDQLLIVVYSHDDIKGGLRTYKYVIESKVSYQQFPNLSPYGKAVLAKINKPSMDWLRNKGGYDYDDPNNSNETTKYKKFFNLPVTLANEAVRGSTTVTYNKKTNTYQTVGTCEGKKCVTSITFKANGFLSKVDYQLVDGTGWTILFDLPVPTAPLVDRTKVIDSQTSEIAKY